MTMFSSNRHSTRTTRSTTRSKNNRRGGLFHRTDPDRRAGGYKAALHNPNTTRQGRKHAKEELRVMGRGNEAHGHPSLTSRIKHLFRIKRRRSTRSTVRKSRV